MIFLFVRVQLIRLLMPVIATAAYKSHADLLNVATSEESSYSAGEHFPYAERIAGRAQKAYYHVQDACPKQAFCETTPRVCFSTIGYQSAAGLIDRGFLIGSVS